MTNETDAHEDASLPSGDTAPEDSPARAASDAPVRPLIDVEALEQTATRIGGVLGRIARRATDAGERAAREAGPEAARLAERARAAAEAARPHLEQAGRSAARYVREHDREIGNAVRTGAEIGARYAVPPVLRPVIDALELRHPRPPLRGQTPPEPDSGTASEPPRE